MTRRRDIIILVVLFLVLVVFTVLGPVNSQDDQPLGGILTTHSSAPDGALALLRWLQGMGYDAGRLEFREFALDAQTDALFILNPSTPMSRSEAAEVMDWVDAGGTLIVVEDRAELFVGSNQMLETLSLELQPYEGEDDTTEIEQGMVLQPVLNEPPLDEVPLRTTRVLESERGDIAPLVGVDDDAVLVGIQQGLGYIYVSSASYPFTNQGLRTEGSAALLRNLLRRVPPSGSVLFDEYHHGFFEPPSMRSVIMGNPWGWALIYTLLILAAFFVVTGRRFGRPVPLREEVARRSSTEYIEGMADLFQRGGKRAFILKHYHQAFKRRMAKPYGINPRLDDEAFVAELAHYRNDLDREALLSLLARLRREQVREDEMLRAIADADTRRSR
jgi:hypothetical protein